MHFITEQALRDGFANGVPDHYQVPEGSRLTPSARQYLRDLGLIRPGASKQPARAQTGPKPEHMTHLEYNVMASKGHPRIELRGRIDTIGAEVLLVMHGAPARLQKPLADVLALYREILAADFLGVPLEDWMLDGMDEKEVHRASHHPEEFGFTGHILPSASDGVVSLQINRLRTLAREVELVAVRAFVEGAVNRREDLVLALNRISSFLYVLELRAATGEG